jgi:hypothetical protein
MGSAITTDAPGLPVVAADQNAEALIGRFTAAIVRDSGSDELPRLPTEDERREIQQYATRMARLCAPTRESKQHQAEALMAIGAVFAGIPSMRNTDNAKTAAFYLSELGDLPVFAIKAACEAFRKGEIAGCDPDFAPTTVRLYGAAKKFAERALNRRYGAERILLIRKALPPPLSPEKAAELRDRMAGLASSLREKLDAVHRDVAERVASETLAGSSERMIEREYQHLKMRPIKAGDIPVSPALAKQLGGLVRQRRIDEDDGEPFR